MTLQEIINEMMDGSELVIVSSERNFDSCIFWIEDDGSIYSFCRMAGVLKRTDLTIDNFEQHIKNMIHEKALLFVRGGGK